MSTATRELVADGLLVTPVSHKLVGLSKTPTGISGLDVVTGGGLPRGRSTLVRRLPAPLRKVIGDLPNAESVLVGLRLGLD